MSFTKKGWQYASSDISLAGTRRPAGDRVRHFFLPLLAQKAPLFSRPLSLTSPVSPHTTIREWQLHPLSDFTLFSCRQRSSISSEQNTSTVLHPQQYCEKWWPETHREARPRFDHKWCVSHSSCLPCINCTLPPLSSPGPLHPYSP